MTLHEAVRHFRWDATHDYRKHDTVNGRIFAIYGLGLYEADLLRLREMVPDLKVNGLRRDGTWLRVDVVEEA